MYPWISRTLDFGFQFSEKKCGLYMDVYGIWFLTERDWSQGCCHGNNIVGVILCLLWCTLLVPSLKITAAIFLEIFLIQYFIVLVERSMTSSLPSFA